MSANITLKKITIINIKIFRHKVNGYLLITTNYPTYVPSIMPAVKTPIFCNKNRQR